MKAHKQAILGAREHETRLTRAFSGRPARGIVNRFMTAVGEPFRLAASTLGPVIGGFLYDATGSYAFAFGVFAAAFALGGTVALAARPPESQPA